MHGGLGFDGARELFCRFNFYGDLCCVTLVALARPM
jgi:hypothetical protein